MEFREFKETGLPTNSVEILFLIGMIQFKQGQKGQVRGKAFLLWLIKCLT
jgi:hypothetical protein